MGPVGVAVRHQEPHQQVELAKRSQEPLEPRSPPPAAFAAAEWIRVWQVPYLVSTG